MATAHQPPTHITATTEARQLALTGITIPGISARQTESVARLALAAAILATAPAVALIPTQAIHLTMAAQEAMAALIATTTTAGHPAMAVPQVQEIITDPACPAAAMITTGTVLIPTMALAAATAATETAMATTMTMTAGATA